MCRIISRCVVAASAETTPLLPPCTFSSRVNCYIALYSYIEPKDIRFLKSNPFLHASLLNRQTLVMTLVMLLMVEVEAETVSGSQW